MACFTTTHRYPSVFLQLAEVMLDQVSPFVGFLVECCWKLPIGFWWYDRDHATFQQIISQPIRIESPIRQQMRSRQITDQRISLAQIVRLSHCPAGDCTAICREGIIAYSKSASDAISLNMRWKASALTHLRNRLNTLFHLPKSSGNSRLPIVAPLVQAQWAPHPGADNPQDSFNEQARITSVLFRIG